MARLGSPGLPGAARPSCVECRVDIPSSWWQKAADSSRGMAELAPVAALDGQLDTQQPPGSTAKGRGGGGDFGVCETYRSVREEGSGAPSPPVRQEAIAELRSRPT